MLTPRAQAATHPSFTADNTLYVITPISNPKRYESRYRLYHQFVEMCAAQPNVHLVTIEAAFGDRDFALHKPGDRLAPRQSFIGVRTSHELWVKENLINIAVSHLPWNWKYVAWVDADVLFTRTDWAIETLHQLQHYKMVQMFSHTADLGPNHELIVNNYHILGFVAQYLRSGKITDPRSSAINSGGGLNGHPGYAWAMTRDAWDGVGGLIDTAVAGAGDHHMALAAVGHVDLSISERASKAYGVPLFHWQDRAKTAIGGSLGCVPGTLMHYWHGKKAQRGYQDRWAMLRDFDPNRDIVRDYQGLWQIAPGANQFRDEMRRYFSSRNEDSIDL